MLRTILHIRIDRDDEIEDVFDRGQRLNVMPFFGDCCSASSVLTSTARSRWNRHDISERHTGRGAHRRCAYDAEWLMLRAMVLSLWT
jgi:hypothetical protein